MSEVVRIPDDVIASLYAHARETFPEECCGYLRGDDAIREVVRCRNAQADGEHPTHPERGAEAGFVIAGRELFDFARSFSGALPARIVYHSHTNGRAYLSEVDRQNALGPQGPIYPVDHLVIGVTATGVTEAARYAWDADIGDFVEVARWDARC
jgi:[CysO sulfur-carrier protein]-S-L-cysteine hydrolase